MRPLLISLEAYFPYLVCGLLALINSYFPSQYLLRDEEITAVLLTVLFGDIIRFVAGSTNPRYKVMATLGVYLFILKYAGII